MRNSQLFVWYINKNTESEYQKIQIQRMRIFPLFFFGFLQAEVQNEQNLLVVTVATEATDGFIRWEESVKRHNLDYKVSY